MNPWSRAEPESEAIERELFAGRARALEARERAVIPPLAAVLRGAEQSRETETARTAYGRAFVAMALAAACMMATVTKLPSARTRGSIAAEMDASAPRTASTFEMASGETCTLDDEVLVSEERSCSSPGPLFTAAPQRSSSELATLSSTAVCGSDEARSPEAVCR